MKQDSEAALLVYILLIATTETAIAVTIQAVKAAYPDVPESDLIMHVQRTLATQKIGRDDIAHIIHLGEKS